MKFVATIVAGVLLVMAVAALPSAPQQVPSPKDVVAPTTYVSLDPAGRGSQFQIAVVLKIRSGFHINAREKSAEYLIATDLRANVPAGFQLGEVSYPKGALHTFTFSKEPLNVYEGTITLRLPATVLANAPLGAQHIPLKLRYQACSTEICLPPVTLALDAALNVASSAAAVKPAHPEIFGSK
ncbi:MAG: protein-disulfide reductase DsbD domain-containing protein [Candidatus Acidiferrum sp.]